MEEITLEFIKNYIIENQFNLKPTQLKMSFPIIKKFCLLIQNSEITNPIKIHEDAIIDGHHRYISSQICNHIPEIINWQKSNATITYKWTDVTVESIDFDNPD